MKKTKADFKIKKLGASDGKRIGIKIITVTVSLFALFITYAYLKNVDSAARNTVKVVKVKNGLSAYAYISKDDVEGYDIIEKEYDKENMVLFEDAEDQVYGKYAAYYIRKSTVLYKDQLTEEKPIRNEWLHSLSPDEEVVTIPYNYLEAGGDILLPGDSVRIRVSYEAEATQAVTADDNPNAYYQNDKKSTKTDLLFDSIVVKDMINGNGHSVYEIYKEVTRLDEKQRQEVMKSKEFTSNSKPRALLLAAMPEDMERYAMFKNNVGSGNFLITILSRANSDIGINELPTIETEVRSWIDGKTDGEIEKN